MITLARVCVASTRELLDFAVLRHAGPISCDLRARPGAVIMLIGDAALVDDSLS